MEFNYIAGRYSENAHTFKPLGGFDSLKAAQSYAERSEGDFLSSGFLFVSAPEGIYIHGEESRRSNHPMWFSPEEARQDKVFVFSARTDTNICISDLPYDAYVKLQEGDVFTIKEPEVRKTSVLGKLENNKNQIEQEGGVQKGAFKSWNELLNDGRDSR